jgi:ATP-dependent Clp protease ATP-binding subunit ClpA
MSMLSKNLERSLHRAFGLAGERRHEYATLEHLLLAMTEDDDAVPVLKACGVDIDRLRHDLETFIDNRLKGIITQNPSEPPSMSSRRVARKSQAPTCWWRCSPSATAMPCRSSRTRA